MKPDRKNFQAMMTLHMVIKKGRTKNLSEKSLEDDDILSNDHDDNGGILPQVMPDNDDMTAEKRKSTERIQRKFQIPHSEVFLFEVTSGGLPFKKRNYNVLISVHLVSKKRHLANSVFSTDTGPYLIREDFLKSKWLKAIKLNNRSL